MKKLLMAMFALLITTVTVVSGHCQSQTTVGGLDSNGSRHALQQSLIGDLIVGGHVDNGSAPTAGWYPLYMGGWDGTNIYALKTDSSGRLVLAPTTTTLIQQSSSAITLLTSTVDTTGAGHTVTSTAVTGLGIYKQIQILLNVTAAAVAASDTLDVYIDTSPDSGTTWVNSIHFTQVLGNGGAKQFWAVLDPGGAPAATVTAVTSDAAAGVVRPSMFTDRLRVRYVTVDGGGADTAFTLAVTAFVKS